MQMPTKNEWIILFIILTIALVLLLTASTFLLYILAMAITIAIAWFVVIKRRPLSIADWLALLGVAIAIIIALADSSPLHPTESVVKQNLIGAVFKINDIHLVAGLKVDEDNLQSFKVTQWLTDKEERTARAVVEFTLVDDVTLYGTVPLEGKATMLYKHYEQGWEFQDFLGKTEVIVKK